MNVSALEDKLGHVFADAALLKMALTHCSVEGEKSYERLEFLGDSVLGHGIAAMLFKQFPNESEGMLSKRLSALVRKETLAEIGRKWGVSEVVRIAAGELEDDGSIKESVLSDVVEALLAAVYLEAGMGKIEALIGIYWQPMVDKVRLKDGKSELQEILQGRNLPLPVYRVIEEEGQDHNKIFTVEVRASGQKAKGQGGSKQKAEQAAADTLLEILNGGE